MKAPVESRPLRRRSSAANVRRAKWRRSMAILWHDVASHPALVILLCGYVSIFVVGWWFYFSAPNFEQGAPIPGAVAAADTKLPDELPRGRELLSPRPGAVFGTDRYGVGVLTRVLRGAAETLSAALVGSAGAVALSFLVVLFTAWLFGSRGYEVLIALGGSAGCLPAVALAWWLSAALAPGFWTVTAVIAATGSVLATEHLAKAFSESENEWHVVAARAAGVGRLALLRTQVVPFVWQRLVSFGAMLLPGAVLLECALSFAGFGLGPDSPDCWGQLIAEGQSLMFEAPWLLIAPGMVIAGTVGWLSLTARSIRKVTREKDFLSLV